MIIEICGTGCAKCHATMGNVQKVVKELGLELGDEAQVVEIKDILQISARGVIMTPAVVIDGVKVSEGRIPSTEEVKKWIEERR